MLRKVAVVVFALLAVAFLLRTGQYAFQWLRGASSPDVNYKALTVWSLIYVVVCGSIALVVSKIPKDDESEEA